MFTYNSHWRADEDAAENAPIEVKAVADVRQVGTVHSTQTTPDQTTLYLPSNRLLLTEI